MAKRKSLSVRTRFEVFKRDGFKCQYCGRCAPEVVLRVDHINPVAKGGDNDLLNLVTACFECNAGKSDKKLDDSSAVALQVEQLQILNERRVQLEMMLEWKRSLKSLSEVEVNHVAEVWLEESGAYLSEHGMSELRKLLKRFGVDMVTDAIEIACDRYADRNVAFDKIGGICFIKKKGQSDPVFGTISQVRGILMRAGHHIGARLPEIVREAIDAGLTSERIIRAAKEARCWTAFYQSLLEVEE